MGLTVKKAENGSALRYHIFQGGGIVPAAGAVEVYLGAVPFKGRVRDVILSTPNGSAAGYVSVNVAKNNGDTLCSTAGRVNGAAAGGVDAKKRLALPANWTRPVLDATHAQVLPGDSLVATLTPSADLTGDAATVNIAVIIEPDL